MLTGSGRYGWRGRTFTHAPAQTLLNVTRKAAKQGKLGLPLTTLDLSSSPRQPTSTKNPEQKARDYSWLGIECLVKTFDRGEDEKVDADEINKLLDEDDQKEQSS